jgi:hypothetical protein
MNDRRKTMSHLMIDDLAESRDLDVKAMRALRGGTNSWFAGLGPVANVNVGVNQNITQLQNVEVNALNNVGVIGPGFVPPSLTISPSQCANANVAL